MRQIRGFETPALQDASQQHQRIRPRLLPRGAQQGRGKEEQEDQHRVLRHVRRSHRRLELARAQIAYQLRKEYSQDEELDWGCLIDKKADNKLQSKELGPTFKKRK